MPRTRSSESGLSLVEVVVALAIVSMVTAVAIPAASSAMRLELKSSAAKISGLMKATYDEAALTAKPCRLVFDFEKRSVTAQVGDAHLTLRDERRGGLVRALSNTQKPDDHKADEEMDVRDLVQKRYDYDLTSAAPKAGFSAIEGAKPLNLPGGIRFEDIEVEHQMAPIKSGQAFLYFFPTGLTEHALIHLKDEQGRVFAVELEALSGRTRIYDHRLDFKDDLF